MCRRCKICERDIVSQLVDPHPEDRKVIWEVCPFCQRQIDALAKWADQTCDLCGKPSNGVCAVCLTEYGKEGVLVEEPTKKPNV